MSSSHKKKPLKALLAEQNADPGQRPVTQRPTRPTAHHNGNPRALSTTCASGIAVPQASSLRTSFASSNSYPGTFANVPDDAYGTTGAVPDPARPLGVLLRSCGEILRTYRQTGVELSEAERQTAWQLFTSMFPVELQSLAGSSTAPTAEPTPSARAVLLFDHSDGRGRRGTASSGSASSTPSLHDAAASAPAPATQMPATAFALPAAPPRIPDHLQARLYDLLVEAESAADVSDAAAGYAGLGNRVARLVEAETALRADLHVVDAATQTVFDAARGPHESVPIAKVGIVAAVVEAREAVNRRTAAGVPCCSRDGVVRGVLVVARDDGGATLPPVLPEVISTPLLAIASTCGVALARCRERQDAAAALDRIGHLVSSFAASDVSDAAGVEDLERRLVSAARQIVDGQRAILLRDVSAASDGGQLRRRGDGIAQGLWQIAADAAARADVIAVDVANSSDYFLTPAEARAVLAVPLVVRHVRASISPVLRECSAAPTPTRKFSPERNESRSDLTGSFAVGDTPTQTAQSPSATRRGSPAPQQRETRIDVLLIINKQSGDSAEHRAQIGAASVFAAADVDIMRRFVELIRPAMQVAEMWGEAEQRAKVLGQVLAVARSVMDMDMLKPEDIAETIMDRAQTLLLAEKVQLYLVDKESSELTCTLRPTGDDGKGGGSGGIEFRQSIDKGLSGACCRARARLNVVDARTDPRFCDEYERRVGLNTRSVLCEPIVFNGECLAVAVAFNKTSNGRIIAFTPEDERLLGFVSVFIGFALHSSGLIAFTARSAREALELSRHHGTATPRPSAVSVMTSTVAASTGDLPAAAAGAPPTVASVATSTAAAPATALRDSIPASVVDAILAVELPDDLVASFSTADFDIFALQATHGDRASDVAIRLVVNLFQQTGMLARAGCTERTMASFIAACRAKYRRVPYHNFFHAVDVLQTLYVFLAKGRANVLLHPDQQYVLLITALVHDLDHMGVNNSFHLKTDSPLGILSSASGNESVLEVHHAALAIQILENPETNVFAGLSEQQQREAYIGMVESILATDMARHRQLTDKFVETFADFAAARQEAAANGPAFAPSLSRDQQILLMQVLVKAADISNVTKPFHVSKGWAQLVTEEFFRQGDKEKAKGHQILPMFDRTLNTELAKGQIGFISFIASPYFSTIVETVFDGLRWCTDRIAANKAQWEHDMSTGGSGATAQLVA